MTILSDGGFSYEVVEGWGDFPPELDLGDVAAVAVDARDRVYLFTRGAHPVIVLSPEGQVVNTWGHGMFNRPHGLHIGADEAIYCTDDGDHVVRKCTLDGELLMTLGVPGVGAAPMSNLPFCRCTHTALSPHGDLYVSDGYANACVHKFDPAGRLLKTWGGSGVGPGEFYIPHNLVCDADGWVYVADRENHRIQVFDGAGRFETEWRDMHRPCALAHGAGGGRKLFYVGEIGPALAMTLSFPNLGPRISILDETGQVLARLSAGPAGVGPGRFVAPHGVAADSRGDLYVGEVSYRAWPITLPDEPQPARLPTIHKLRRLS